LLGGVRFPIGNEGEKAADGGQATVPCSDTPLAIALDMLEESQQRRLREIFSSQRRHLALQLLCHKAKKQSPRIAVSKYSPVRGVALLHEPFVEERVEQTGENRKNRFSH
jgi:hypothetical protein